MVACAPLSLLSWPRCLYKHCPKSGSLSRCCAFARAGVTLSPVCSCHLRWGLVSPRSHSPATSACRAGRRGSDLDSSACPAGRRSVCVSALAYRCIKRCCGFGGAPADGTASVAGRALAIGRFGCPVPAVWVGGSRGTTAGQAFRVALARLVACRPWAARVAEAWRRGVILLRVWREHHVLCPERLRRVM